MVALTTKEIALPIVLKGLGAIGSAFIGGKADEKLSKMQLKQSRENMLVGTAADLANQEFAFDVSEVNNKRLLAAFRMGWANTAALAPQLRARPKSPRPPQLNDVVQQAVAGARRF